MGIEIKNYSIEELYNAVNVSELFNEYEQESAIKGLPRISAKKETYLNLEKSGTLHIIGAFLDNVLIGFVTIISPIMPHYDALVSVAESLFVAKKYRKSGAGLKLQKAAEEHANSLGSPGLLFSAPYGGVLAEVLPRRGYKETNRVFFKKFNEASNKNECSLSSFNGK